MTIPTTIMTCVLAVMQPTHTIPPVQLSHNTAVCPSWAHPGERACYVYGTIYAPVDADAGVLAHEYAHHVQMFDQRAVLPIDAAQRRRLEAEAVSVQLECGRV